MTQLPDFDATTYQERPITPSATRVPWNIGELQPAIAALIAAGQVRSPVLDAGCGIGETAIDFLLHAHLPDDQLARSPQPVAAHPQQAGHRP